jgi:hypothetical protein
MVAAPIWMQITAWRETGRQVKMGPLDGRLSMFLILLLLFPSKIMLLICISAMAFFYALEYRGYTLPNAFRKLKVIMAGKRRNGVHYWRQNKFRY